MGSNFGLAADFTNAVATAAGPKANPRLASLVESLTRHLHEFCKENSITADEFAMAIDFFNWSGRMSDDKRNEGNLLANVLGLESLVDDITYKLANDATTVPTVLGPFYRKNAPKRKMGESIVFGIEHGDHTWMHGKVIDSKTGEPLKDAIIDIWETAPNGKYDVQDPDQVDMNLRGVYTTGADGIYELYCLRPTTYSIPVDGPAGQLLQMLDRHTMRPAHIHVLVSAPGYKPIITELFDRKDPHVYDDAVFAVKESLIVDFLPRKNDSKAQFELEYNFRLAKSA
ncbi:Intradiol ring-cleavage dioxygenase [Aspergillus carlsbadensis]|nr:Intradiol ring-cleavage dioxygenase [Aspergillus carlsbadensis]